MAGYVKKTFLFPPELWREVEEAMQRDGITKDVIAARIALAHYARRKKRPSSEDIEEATQPTGRPDIAEWNRQRAKEADE